MLKPSDLAQNHRDREERDPKQSHLWGLLEEQGVGQAGQTGSPHAEATGSTRYIIYYKYTKRGYIKIPDHEFIGHLGGKFSDSKPHGVYG